MWRDPASPDFAKLVASGRLTPGTRLYHRNRGGAEIVAFITNEGIQLGGKVYVSPSGAAVAVRHSPTDGWLFWRLADSDLTLDAIRKEAIADSRT